MIAKPGIYVAFDRLGAHFDYARHPDSHICTGRTCEQAQKIEAMTAEALLRGGKVVHLSLEEFDAMILHNARSDAHSVDRVPAPEEMVA